MKRQRIYELAKEWNIDSQAILAQLHTIGSRAKTAHSSITENDAAKVKTLLSVPPLPVPLVGQQKVVSERVMTQETEGTSTTFSIKERVVERRVQTGVIRRRTTRVAVPQEIGTGPDDEPAPSVTATRPAPTRSEPTPPPVFMLPTLNEEPTPLAVPVAEKDSVFAPPGEKKRDEDTALISAPLQPRFPAQPTDTDTPAQSPRILGRIDLRKTRPVTHSPQRPTRAQSATVTTQVKRPAPVTPFERSTPARPRTVIVHTPTATKRDAAEERFLRNLRRQKSSIEKPAQSPAFTVPKARKRIIKVAEVITVADLAKEMGVKATEVIAKLFSLGVLATINQVLDVDTATLAATDFGYTVENVALDLETLLTTTMTAPAELERTARPPVVTVMGHVDHGKTSLLDAIRQTNVTAREAGGITQHIGAYDVEVSDRTITFLDTPGHEAFTAMRARGARVTDIVILVVAADDGVMPQTIEAINHARAAQVPFVVAITKIDKPEANIERVKKGVASYGVVPEEWGGDAIFVPVSAKTGEGLQSLLEMLVLQAEVLELKAARSGPTKGTVVEAKLDKGRGPVATVLVHEGTLRVGDPCVCGAQYGKVRALFNSRGQRVTAATPAMPVEVLGLSGVPAAGDALIVARGEIQARQVAEHRQGKQRVTALTTAKRFSLADLGQAATEQKELRVILKADVQGSIEALRNAVERLSTAEVKLTVLHASVGAISETDVLLATASKALIIGFHVRPEAKAAKMAEREGIEIRLYEIIYEVVADVRAALEGLLAPVYTEKLLGSAEVRQVFTIPRVGVVAGSFVKEGKLLRAAQARLVRDGITVHQGRISSLRRFKDDVREVVAGYECGIGLEHYQDIKSGDVIEAFELVQGVRRLEQPSPQGEPRLSA
ncbi:MAG: translation initiation factor IF-2 [Candidatus Binatia bacterium]